MISHCTLRSKLAIAVHIKAFFPSDTAQPSSYTARASSMRRCRSKVVPKITYVRSSVGSRARTERRSCSTCCDFRSLSLLDGSSLACTLFCLARYCRACSQVSRRAGISICYISAQTYFQSISIAKYSSVATLYKHGCARSASSTQGASLKTPTANSCKTSYLITNEHVETVRMYMMSCLSVLVCVRRIQLRNRSSRGSHQLVPSKDGVRTALTGKHKYFELCNTGAYELKGCASDVGSGGLWITASQGVQLAFGFSKAPAHTCPRRSRTPRNLEPRQSLFLCDLRIQTEDAAICPHSNE